MLLTREPELARRIRPRIPRPANPAEDDEVVEVDEQGLTPAEDEPTAEGESPTTSTGR